MENFSRGQGETAESGIPEPIVRRWPHPVDGFAVRQADPALHYICSALSYQNQMLADIKALLQQLVVDSGNGALEPEANDDGEK